MKKDAYYFPHFSNARNDLKLLKLRRVLGLEGYGIYFCLIEILRDQTDFKYPIQNMAELEYELRIPKEKISNVIMDYDLFNVDEKSNFFSPKMVEYLQPYIQKSTRAREAANLRWSNANAYPNALPQHSKSIANADASKVKKSKVKKNINRVVFIPPSLEDVVTYFKEKGYSVQVAERAFNYYNENDWKDSKGKQVSSWKSKMNSVWFTDENRVKSTVKRLIL